MKGLVTIISVQIIDLEHKLRKTGKLNTLAELKDFWDFMLSPIEPETPPPPKPRPLPHPQSIQEEEEEYSDSWAITALPSEHYREKVTIDITEY